MPSLSDYQYTHERITLNELDVAAVLLDEASKSRRLTIKYSELKASPLILADLARIAIIEQQLAEALQEGRLVILPRDPATPGATPEGNKE